MSLNKKRELTLVAKNICRELRKHSTNAERILWTELRNRKFCSKKFNRQYPLFYDINGAESFFIADFYCNELKLIIELDGIIHKYKLKKDKERTEILNSLGLNILRFSNSEVEENAKEVLYKISKYYKSLKY